LISSFCILAIVLSASINRGIFFVWHFDSSCDGP